MDGDLRRAASRLSRTLSARSPEPAGAPPPVDVPPPVMAFEGLTLRDREKKKARTAGDPKRSVLRDVTLTVPAGRYAILGEQTDRTAFVDLLVGRRSPAEGRLRIHTKLSYPIGRVRFFTVPVNGADFVRFLARLYHFDEEVALDVLGAVLPRPNVLVHRLDDAQNSERLALSLGIACFIDAETYVFDGNLGDSSFPLSFVRFVAENLATRTARRNILIATRQPQIATSLAVDSLVIDRGRLFVVEGVDASKVKTAAAAVEQEQREEREEDDAEIF